MGSRRKGNIHNWAWLACILISSMLLGGCTSVKVASDTELTAPTIVETTAETASATEPSTLPPRPAEDALPEIEPLLAGVPNSRLYIADGMVCVETCDETTTGTGSIAYDRFEGGADAWQKVIDNSVALCLLMRTKMDDEGVTDTPAKVVVMDHRFPRPILTVVDGQVTEDTVAIELASDPPMLPNAPTGSDGDTTIGSGSNGSQVWISEHGNKYHSSSDCSNMENPWQVSRQEAINMGREACKICY